MTTNAAKRRGKICLSDFADVLSAQTAQRIEQRIGVVRKRSLKCAQEVHKLL